MWNDAMIRRAVRGGRGPAMVETPATHVGRFGTIRDEQIQPASLDLRLGDYFIRHPDGSHFHCPEGKSYPLSTGECVLASTVERFDIPNNVVARVEGKSSLARVFLTIHSAGFIDPGFKGDITLEIKNDGMIPIRLHPGMLIAQVSFQTLDAPAERPYGHEELNSHYQGQAGPRKSRLGGN